LWSGRETGGQERREEGGGRRWTPIGEAKTSGRGGGGGEGRGGGGHGGEELRPRVGRMGTGGHGVI
jgi:hypothetical protein